MQRYFIKNNQIINNDAYITGQDYHHIKNVMRMRVDDEIYLCNENEESYIAKIVAISGDSIKLELMRKLDENSEMSVKITIAHGLVRREKQEEVMRRITELGAYEYIPVNMERSIVKVKDNKKERYNLIVKEASEQSHRKRIMKISDVVSFKEFIDLKDKYDLCLFAYEEEGRNQNKVLKSLLKEFTGKKVLALFGPEGGFSLSEVDTLKKNGFIAVGLGPRIMRTETAPLYFMSVCSYQFELGEK